MSVASNLRNQGLGVLLGVAGDPLTFRGSTVRALVNRQVSPPNDAGEVDLSLLDASIIEVKRSAISGAAPSIGEVFVEGTRRHRVARVEVSDLSFRCICQQSTE